MNGRITIRTPAKVNLFLEVRGRRDDGYHEIRTVFLPVDPPTDEIIIRATPGQPLTLDCSDGRLPVDDRNLMWQAAARFAAAAGIAPHWHMTLNKHIPVAAGLGGGSSDAAATLLALEKLTATESLPPERRVDLPALAAVLGSDVPFFLDPRPAVGTGRGDRLVPIAAALDAVIVLLNPGFPAAVRWAYANRIAAATAAGTCDALLAALRQGDLKRVAAAVRNDLEPGLRRKFPVLDMLAERLLAAGALAAMVSGSGPTVFGIFPPGFSADRLLREFRRDCGPAAWSAVARCQPSVSS